MRTRRASALVVLLSAGCGSSSHDVPAAEPNRESSFVIAIGPVQPELIIAVVDDRPAATELRATVARTFDEWDSDLLRSTASCQPPFDPAAFHPIDRSVLVVHPSAAPDERYTSALDQPALSWRSNQRSDAEHAAWSDAVRAALEPKTASHGAFAALDASQQAITLVRRLRDPANDEEAGIVAALPGGGRFTNLVYALGEDDASSSDAASLAVPNGNDSAVAFAILPAAEPPSTPSACYDTATENNDTERYAAWRKAQGVVQAGHWPCADETFYPWFFADCAGNCLGFSPLAAADGSARCTITATLSDDAPCDAAFGWLDPVAPDGTRAPKLERQDGVSRRVCEIQQLSGDALRSCVTTLDCEGCEPGWCATQVPELLDTCSSGAPNPFRFVGGSDRAATARAKISCEKPD